MKRENNNQTLAEERPLAVLDQMTAAPPLPIEKTLLKVSLALAGLVLAALLLVSGGLRQGSRIHKVLRRASEVR